MIIGIVSLLIPTIFKKAIKLTQKTNLLQIDTVQKEIIEKPMGTVAFYVVFYVIFRSFEPGEILVNNQ